MTVKQFAEDHNLWQRITASINSVIPADAATLLEKISQIPIKHSRATRRLGAYVYQNKQPVCIRLQFSQEEDCLRQTFLHEVAHACDHLSRKKGSVHRQAHGESWKKWARALGISTAAAGESAALKQLHQQRLKLVGVCQLCGTEFHRVRRLDKKKKYTHNQCGGKILKF